MYKHFLCEHLELKYSQNLVINSNENKKVVSQDGSSGLGELKKKKKNMYIT